MAGEKALAQELTTQTSAGAGVNARPALTSIASDLAQLKNMAVLLKTIRTGDYPVGMTAADLAAIEIRPGETALILAALWGHYPRGTTAADLARVKTLSGETVLHVAAAEGNLPVGTTVDDLVNTVSEFGRSSLGAAVISGNYPVGTTVAHLAQVEGDYGYTALEDALFWGDIPPTTTDLELRSTLTKAGVTAWDLLVNSFESPGRCADQDIAIGFIYQFPRVLESLHPASNEYQRDLVRRLLANPKLMPSMRQMLSVNPEILAMML